jgi:DNA-binding NtrC family response regulator
VETLERFGGNQVAAAKKLAIPRQTLQNQLKK